MGIEWVTIGMIVIFIVLLTVGLPFPWAMGATATMVGFVLFEPGFMQMMVGRIYDLMLKLLPSSRFRSLFLWQRFCSNRGWSSNYFDQCIYGAGE